MQNTSNIPPDQEFQQYWSLLTRVQKETVIAIIKSFTRPDGEFLTDRYSEELKQALNRVRSGEYYTQEQVREIFKRRK